VADKISEDVAPRNEGLTTADLAGAGEKPRTIETESRAVNRPVESQLPKHNIILGEGSFAAPSASSVPNPGTAAGAAAAPAKMQEEHGPLFSSEEANNLRARWDSVQVAFVDEPRKAVEDADSLVAATMKRLAEVFAEERQKLEHQWDRGDNVSTEDLRQALRRYRSFFSRLLSI
jgi:hypothetical protein